MPAAQCAAFTTSAAIAPARSRKDCGSRKVFRCGYHGWTYALDGQLLNAPEMEGACDFSHADFALRPVQAAEWEGLVFVNLDPAAEPLTTALGELPAQAAKFDFARMRFYKRHDYVMECNWKVYIDNFLEGYHLPSVHPSLNRELDYSQYVTTTFARHSMQTSPIRGPENEANVSRRYAQSRGDLAAEYYWIFPNWMLNCYPDNMSLNIVLPLGPERCVAIFVWFFPPETLNDRRAGEHVSLQRRDPARRRPHLRGGVPQPEIAELFPRPLQREAGKSGVSFPPAVRGGDGGSLGPSIGTSALTVTENPHASPITLTPIGTVHGPIREPLDEVFGGLTARIELDAARFTPESLQGPRPVFARRDHLLLPPGRRDAEIVYTARRPRNRADWPEFGIFAPARPHASQPHRFHRVPAGVRRRTHNYGGRPGRH